MNSNYQSEAKLLDAQDSLANFRDKFLFPKKEHKKTITYLCGHSLGLQPIKSKDNLNTVMDDWASFGVEKWFSKEKPWHTASHLLRPSLGKLVGALHEEVTIMNSLTVNIHLMLASFYNPTSTRFKIITDSPIFPSDLHALKSFIKLKGGNPDTSLIQIKPRNGEATLHIDDIKKTLSHMVKKQHSSGLLV